MRPATIKALLVNQSAEGQISQELTELPIDSLPLGDLLIKVHYSSLNYKDALSATGHSGVTKKFPHVPGIDAAGTVVSSTDDHFSQGDAVIVTGFDQGMNTWGGFAEYIRVPAAWAIPLPAGMSFKESMILGTAGLTAALCIEALSRNGVKPNDGEVLVTGSTGGVGSLSIAILAKLGYTVVAVTGKPAMHEYVRSLGASSIISREAVIDQTGKPMLKERWAGVVDTVGGAMLATAIKSTRYGGCITACGLVGGTELPTTVYPFILRGVCLQGIDSANCPMELRSTLWQKLANEWKPDSLANLAKVITLAELPDMINTMLNGQSQGRIVVVPEG